MRRLVLLALLPGVAVAQTDHDNIDAGRPLRFEDAEPISFRSLAFEYGFGLNAPRGRNLGLDGQIEFLYGINLNGQLEIGFSPLLGGRSGTSSTTAGVGDYDLAYLYSLRQESRRSPALALKAELSLPGQTGGATNFRLRGIATRTVGAYDRVHFNVDADFSRGRGRLGAILGYSRPLGYPTRFDTTGVAEIAYLGDRTLSVGLGVRRQISPRAVLDLGIQSDLLPGRGVDGNVLRLVAGYSVSF